MPPMLTREPKYVYIICMLTWIFACMLRPSYVYQHAEALKYCFQVIHLDLIYHLSTTCPTPVPLCTYTILSIKSNHQLSSCRSEKELKTSLASQH